MKSITACFLLLAMSAALPVEAGNANVFGRWKVAQVVGHQDTTSLSSDQAEKLIGEELIIEPESVRFSGDLCEKPRFISTRKRTYKMFRDDYKFEPKNIQLPDPVTEIKADCRNPSSVHYFYVKDKNRIIFYWEGFFLSAVRQSK